MNTKMITTLKENQIFVFGSNELGHHLGGGAKQAKEQFGAVDGIGEGLCGQSYAFPTLNKKLEKRSHTKLRLSVYRLYTCCYKNPDKEFLLTAVGTGIAGFSVDFMKKLFRNSPPNLILPEEFN